MRPDGLCVITLFDTLHSAAGTFHSVAAAAINIVRAVAPALRTYSFDSRMARLPAVGPTLLWKRVKPGGGKPRFELTQRGSWVG